MKSKVRLTYERFLAYFSSKMTEREKHAFEKSVMQDDFESDAFDGLSKLSPHELEKDFAELNSNLQGRIKSKPKRKLVWLPYAASILVLVGLGWVLFQINNDTSVNEFVSQELEQTKTQKQLSPESVAKQDSLQEIIDVDLEDTIEVVIDEGQEIAEVEIQAVEESEELADVDVMHEQVPQQKTAMIAKLDYSDKMPLAKKLDTAEKKLSGKVSGVSASKKYRSVKIRGFSSIPKKEMVRKIKGLVVDENKQPIPGVNIVVKGTTKSVLTDIDGNFAMSLVDTNSDYKLTASFIGFKPKDVDVSDSLLVVLEQDNTPLNEVVVTGYSMEKKSDQTGSVSEVEIDKPAREWNKAQPSESKNISSFKQRVLEKLDHSKLQHLSGKYKLKLSFLINSDGSITDMQFRGNPDAVLVSEIKRIIPGLEKWKPATSNGVAVSSTVKLKLKIDLD